MQLSRICGALLELLPRPFNHIFYVKRSMFAAFLAFLYFGAEMRLAFIVLNEF